MPELVLRRGERITVRVVLRARSMKDMEKELDRKALQGTWVAEKIEFQGKALPNEDCCRFRLVFNGEQAHLSLPDGRAVDGQLLIDTTKFPREIDIVGRDNKWIRGVYQVGINILTLCIGDIDRERPLAFVGSLDPASKQMLVTLKRETDDGFRPLFDGKTLSGWKTHSKMLGNWKFEGGDIVGKSPPGSHLFTESGNYENFHLRAEMKTNLASNSGILVRTPFENFSLDAVPGYEADISFFPGRPNSPIGTIWKDSRRIQKALDSTPRRMNGSRWR